MFTHIWLIFMVNVGKYTIHGSYGYIYVPGNSAGDLFWVGENVTPLKVNRDLQR